MKSFKDIINETVNKPIAPEEQNFINQHGLEVKDYPVSQKKTETPSKKKRLADRDQKQSEDDYDQAYVKEETEELSEGAIDDLKKIVKKKSAMDVKLADGSSMKVDLFTASAMTQIYDALNDANKKKFADSINKSETMFMKMMDFAFSKVKK